MASYLVKKSVIRTTNNNADTKSSFSPDLASKEFPFATKTLSSLISGFENSVILSDSTHAFNFDQAVTFDLLVVL